MGQELTVLALRSEPKRHVQIQSFRSEVQQESAEKASLPPPHEEEGKHLQASVEALAILLERSASEWNPPGQRLDHTHRAWNPDDLRVADEEIRPQAHLDRTDHPGKSAIQRRARQSHRRHAGDSRSAYGDPCTNGRAPNFDTGRQARPDRASRVRFPFVLAGRLRLEDDARVRGGEGGG